MRVEVVSPNFRSILERMRGDAAKAAKEAMVEATAPMLGELRDQVTSAGLGGRLANTWRSRVYPDQGSRRYSLQPAGFVWSRAPEIIDSYVKGATIYPHAGRKFLAIPTDNVPQQRGSRGSRKRMSPHEVELAFNQDLVFRRGKRGHVLAFVSAVTAKSGRGLRRATRGRVRQGRVVEEKLMFVLVPSTRMPKLLDLAGPAQRGAARFVAAFERRRGA